MPTCVLSLLLSLVLVVQGAMPAGYMPASIDSGWPVMLCPDGLPQGFLLDDNAAAPHANHAAHSVDHTRHSLHSQPEDATAHNHEADAEPDYCPLGNALIVATIAAAPGVAEDAPQPTLDRAELANLALPGLRIYSPISRGPPAA